MLGYTEGKTKENFQSSDSVKVSGTSTPNMVRFCNTNKLPQ